MNPIALFSSGSFSQDKSAWPLLFANIATIGLAIYQNWQLEDILLIYWIQSIIIGIFQFIKILDLDKFDTTGYKINGRPASPTVGTKYSSAFFFLFHYGGFHFGYLTFLVNEMDIMDANWSAMGFLALMFFFNHLFSFFYNRNVDKHRIPNIGSMMFKPYLRIFPMHFTIIAGGAIAGAASGYIPIQFTLVFFLILKTITDLLSHAHEHHNPKDHYIRFGN